MNQEQGVDEKEQIASVIHNNQQYYVRYKSKQNEPHSAVTQLIQSIYEEFPVQQAYQILRNRIHLNYQPTLMCHSMISIAAKRFVVESVIEIQESAIELRFQHNKYDSLVQFIEKPKSLEKYFNWLKSAQEISTEISADTSFEASTEVTFSDEKKSQEISYKESSVKAILTNQKMSYIIQANNYNQKNKTLHAEVLLLQKYYSLFQRGFNEPVELYTSLECCKMCAAMFWQMHTNPFENLKVFFINKEKGPSARDTILKSGSNSRRSLYKDKIEIDKIVEQKIILNE